MTPLQRRVAESPVFRIAEQYVREWARLDPVSARRFGLEVAAGLSDYSPDGIAQRSELARRRVNELRGQQPVGFWERLAARHMMERLESDLQLYDAGEWMRPLTTVIFELPEALRRIAAGDDSAAAAAALRDLPGVFAQLTKTLTAGCRSRITSPSEETRRCIRAVREWADPPAGVIAALVARAGLDPETSQPLADAAETGARRFADFLEKHYLPATSAGNGVGPAAYERFVRAQLGARVDLDQAYDWGLAEIGRITDELQQAAGELAPGGDVDAAYAVIRADSARYLADSDALGGWLRDYLDQLIDDLAGSQFHIPPLVRAVELVSAPVGSGPAYYLPPTLDLRQRGRVVLPITGIRRARPRAWITTLHHEGVPGHHLQYGISRAGADHLSAYQRTFYVSGHGEGWALYAEHLMAELGYLDDPEARLGMLLGELLRAIRVVIDIGLHLYKPVPAECGSSPGTSWTPQLAAEFVAGHLKVGPDAANNEVQRCLAAPAQATSYKLGERAWNNVRTETAVHNLAAFHDMTLQLGPLGLDHFAEAVREVLSSPDARAVLDERRRS